jgi:Domain of unknown function (DUF1816)
MILNFLRQELTSSVDGFYFRTLKMPWWVEIRTTLPLCIYYFGPFHCKKTARLSQSGYIEDLVQEKACGITVEIKRLRPKVLTVYED